jgi:PAS domain S-box-containing protein
MYHLQVGHIPLAAITAIYLAFALYLLLSERHTRANAFFIIFVLCMHLWALGLVALKLVHGFVASSLLVKLIGVGVVFALPLQVIFALTFYGKSLAKSKVFISGIFLFPVIAFILVATNEFHALAYYNVGGHKITPAPLLILVEYYNFILAIFSCTIYLAEYFGAVEPRVKRHSALLFLGILIFIISGPLGVFLPGIEPLEVQAFGFMPFVMMHTYAIVRFRIASIGPVGLRFLFGNLRDGILLLDQADRVIMANESAGRFLGFAPGQLIEQDFFKLIKEMPNFFESPDSALKRMDEIKEENTHCVFEFDISEPRAMAVAMTCYPVEEKGVELGRMIGLRDVTERRFLQQELQIYSQNLEQAVEEKSEELLVAYEELKKIDETRLMLLQNISHELRTPLVAIKGYAELMIREKTGNINEKQRHFLQVILRNSSHLSHLIGQLLDYAMLESGSLEMERDDLDLVSLLENIMVNAGPAAEQQNLTLDVRLPQIPIVLYADRERLRQAISNLVNNAIKFNRPGGKVEMAVKIIENEKVQVIVSDTGIGITADHQRRIFERFYQADSSTKSLHGGAGIGLALTQEIVEQHHGTLALKSELDVGSTFFVTLPLRANKEDES